MTTNQLRFAELKESVRHNLITEGWTGSGVSENVRHNMQMENISWYGNETQRSVGLGQVSNSAYANRIQASNVSNLRDYQLGQLDVSQQQISVNRHQADTQSKQTEYTHEFQLGQLDNAEYANSIARDRQAIDAAVALQTTSAKVELDQANAGLSRSRIINETLRTGFDTATKFFKPFAIR